MTVLTGLDYYLEYDGVAIKGDYRNFDPGFEFDTVEGTAGGDTVRNYVPTLIKVEPSGTFIVDNNAAGIAIRAVLKEGNDGNLVWGPEGNATGKPKWGVACNISKAQVSATYDAEQEIEVTWYVASGSLLYDGRSATF